MEGFVHAACDGLLATAALVLAWRMRRDPAVCAGAAALGVAATIGTLRFAGISELIPLHTFLSSVAGWASLPLLALHRRLRWPHAIAGLGLACVLAALPLPPLANTLVGVASVVGLVVAFGRTRRWEGAAGALGFPVAALLIGTRGELAGLHRLDVYHVVLTASVAAMGIALHRMGVARS